MLGRVSCDSAIESQVKPGDLNMPPRVNAARQPHVVFRKSQTRFARSRFVHISWVHFRDVFVNWNEELSLRAECAGCGDAVGPSYSWDLFLVNATEKNCVEGRDDCCFILWIQETVILRLLKTCRMLFI